VFGRFFEALLGQPSHLQEWTIDSAAGQYRASHRFLEGDDQ
jgi:hypothetical protein